MTERTWSLGQVNKQYKIARTYLHITTVFEMYYTCTLNILADNYMQSTFSFRPMGYCSLLSSVLYMQCTMYLKMSRTTSQSLTKKKSSM